jgi:hypothetical protein
VDCKWRIISVIPSIGTRQIYRQFVLSVSDFFLAQLVRHWLDYPSLYIYSFVCGITQNEDLRNEKRRSLWHWVHWPKYLTWSSSKK